jgi:hypothetical protein
VFSVNGNIAQEVTLLTGIRKYLVAIPVGAQIIQPDFSWWFSSLSRGECQDIALK